MGFVWDPLECEFVPKVDPILVEHRANKTRNELWFCILRLSRGVCIPVDAKGSRSLPEGRGPDRQCGVYNQGVPYRARARIQHSSDQQDPESWIQDPGS